MCAPLRCLHKAGEYQGAHEHQRYSPIAQPVGGVGGIAERRVSITYHVQDVGCYGNVHGSLNKKVQSVDKFERSSATKNNYKALFLSIVLVQYTSDSHKVDILVRTIQVGVEWESTR